MSAPFRTSYGDIIHRDLKHIHSGFFPPSYRFRIGNINHDGIDILDRIREDQRRRPMTSLPNRCYEYIPEYKTVIPRAPAFRKLSRKQVHGIVSRLKNRDDSTYKKKGDSSDLDSCDAGNKNVNSQLQNRPDRKIHSAPVGGRESNSARTDTKPEAEKSVTSKKQHSQRDVNAIVNRLYSSNTHISELRRRRKSETSSRERTHSSKLCEKSDSKRESSADDENRPNEDTNNAKEKETRKETVPSTSADLDKPKKKYSDKLKAVKKRRP